MIPMGEILKYLEAIKDLVGSNYSVQLTIQKNDEKNQDEDSNALVDKLAQMFSPAQSSASNNSSDLDILDSTEIKRRIADVLSTFRESKDWGDKSK